MTRRIVIRRFKPTDKACMGILTFFEGQENAFTCLTLENPVEGIEANRDYRVPNGIYKLKQHSPSRFEETLRKITGVKTDKMICLYNAKIPASRTILIHWGNTEKDTLGCILLGMTRTSSYSIGESREACKRFYDKLRGFNLESIELEIKDDEDN